MATPGKPDPAAAPPKAPQPAAKGALMRRVFPFLLATNVFIGVYVFAKTYKRDQDKKIAQTAAAAAAVEALSSPPAAITKPAEPTPPPKKVLAPPSEDEQRQVYKWMLEEKRKIKPRNTAEKNKLNEEKALLKEIIRAESLPRLW
ncbi:uncharacterized protein LOC100821305 [Brachypodium distachyon]|uniref:Uncharacterized protein n=1 Tax=Brachypodium distachyon TaxID=15368 RepID=I1HNU3_BRADI|nr:uncharacterized protein LOC100821305 [Brachypodium distachyon]KQK08424.1 hypothetical protein BRADI_2g41770v3 [Brachypodium distachyon]|eukprot:XP_003569255.1 uncharacterized protein LOC100821305 [Brachypodium distachyon]